jgi:glycosyltransferase involved in cell wall biosynthesis
MNPTLCLNMIVKNESRIIKRILESVLPIIDCYCICDTGSTDDTKEIIKTFFKEKNVPGKIVEEKFLNFEHNRNVALDHCKEMSDYILFLDADMILKIAPEFKKQILWKADSFMVLQGSDDFYYNNLRIIKNNGLYKYIGVTHEYLSTPDNQKTINLTKNELFVMLIF